MRPASRSEASRSEAPVGPANGWQSGKGPSVGPVDGGGAPGHHRGKRACCMRPASRVVGTACDPMVGAGETLARPTEAPTPAVGSPTRLSRHGPGPGCSGSAQNGPAVCDPASRVSEPAWENRGLSGTGQGPPRQSPQQWGRVGPTQGSPKPAREPARGSHGQATGRNAVWAFLSTPTRKRPRSSPSRLAGRVLRAGEFRTNCDCQMKPLKREIRLEGEAVGPFMRLAAGKGARIRGIEIRGLVTNQQSTV